MNDVRRGNVDEVAAILAEMTIRKRVTEAIFDNAVLDLCAIVVPTNDDLGVVPLADLAIRNALQERPVAITALAPGEHGDGVAACIDADAIHVEPGDEIEIRPTHIAVGIPLLDEPLSRDLGPFGHALVLLVAAAKLGHPAAGDGEHVLLRDDALADAEVRIDLVGDEADGLPVATRDELLSGSVARIFSGGRRRPPFSADLRNFELMGCPCGP